MVVSASTFMRATAKHFALCKKNGKFHNLQYFYLYLAIVTRRLATDYMPTKNSMENIPQKMHLTKWRWRNNQPLPWHWALLPTLFLQSAKLFALGMHESPMLILRRRSEHLHNNQPPNGGKYCYLGPCIAFFFYKLQKILSTTHVNWRGWAYLCGKLVIERWRCKNIAHNNQLIFFTM